jgi:hypothetical protein
VKLSIARLTISTSSICIPLLLAISLRDVCMALLVPTLMCKFLHFGIASLELFVEAVVHRMVVDVQAKKNPFVFASPFFYLFA